MISNLHCVGMCGPISMAIPFDRSSKFNLIIGIIQYNFGRISIYSIFGVIVGFLGLGIQFVGILQSLSIIAGFGIILYAWRKVLFTGSFFDRFRIHFVQRFTSRSMGKVIKSKTGPKKAPIQRIRAKDIIFINV
jgi:sulfite exporter TauE/SafE